jgi:hypothetical protein
LEFFNLPGQSFRPKCAILFTDWEMARHFYPSACHTCKTVASKCWYDRTSICAVAYSSSESWYCAEMVLKCPRPPVPTTTAIPTPNLWTIHFLA